MTIPAPSMVVRGAGAPRTMTKRSGVDGSWWTCRPVEQLLYRRTGHDFLGICCRTVNGSATRGRHAPFRDRGGAGRADKEDEEDRAEQCPIFLILPIRPI